MSALLVPLLEPGLLLLSSLLGLSLVLKGIIIGSLGPNLKLGLGWGLRGYCGGDIGGVPLWRYEIHLFLVALCFSFFFKIMEGCYCFDKVWT